MFFKIAVFKYLWILRNYWEQFFYRAPSAHYTFQNFYVMIDSLDVFGYKIDIFQISCAIALFSFITLVLESGVHGYFVLVFILKFLVSITFARITTSESETTSSIIATSPSNLLWKMWIWVFWILCFAIIFL